MVSTEQLQEFGSFQEMFTAAAEAAATSFGRPVTGVLYRQGGRRFISTSLPVRMLLSLARRDSATRNSATKTSNPADTRNRPLDSAHVREIANYLTTEEEYLVPPVMLNASRQLQVFAYRTPAETKPCTFVLPHDEYLYVTDGQHRLEALRKALESRPDLDGDSVGVTIIEESDMDKVHQDFFDAAQAKPLAKALLVEYDGREPMNRLAKEVSTQATIFSGRIERIGNVGKNSLMLFTSNQVKVGIAQLVAGLGAVTQAEQAVEAAKYLWRSRVLAFFNEFTTANLQWNEVAMSPLESGKVTDIPNYREKYAHFSGGGLLVLSGVGHSILELDPPSDGSLSEDQRQHIRNLGGLDWSRRSQLWRGNIIDPSGKVNQGRANIALAVARVKSELGLELGTKEQENLAKAEENINREATVTEQGVALIV